MRVMVDYLDFFSIIIIIYYSSIANEKHIDNTIIKIYIRANFPHFIYFCIILHKNQNEVCA